MKMKFLTYFLRIQSNSIVRGFTVSRSVPSIALYDQKMLASKTSTNEYSQLLHVGIAIYPHPLPPAQPRITYRMHDAHKDETSMPCIRHTARTSLSHSWMKISQNLYHILWSMFVCLFFCCCHALHSGKEIATNLKAHVLTHNMARKKIP